MSLTKEVHNLMDSVYQALNSYDEVILTQDEFDDFDSEVRNEVPRVSKVCKHFHYDEYAVMSIKGGDYIAIGITEGCNGEIISGSLSELEYGEAVNLLGWLDN
tara:strand:- start:26249 stop:26557 length:309 start_codon:yes stop_codon:yes gene_type:complete